jgi:nucleotide-binding universal stress UspA family protein
MRKIIVAVDGSEPSLKAARMAADLARATGGQLVLAFVVIPVALPADFYGVASVEFETQMRKDATEILAKAADSLGGVVTERRVLQGPAAETIADAAEAPDIDLVVVGSRGLGAVKRVLLGSVADRLVHVAKKPVLVVR